MSFHSGLYDENATSTRGQLHPRQTASLAALGIVLWFLAALLIRYAGPAGLFDGGLASALLFALTIPAAWLLARLCRRTAGLTPGQLVPGVAVASLAGLLCDAMALTWTPALYGADAAHIVPAVAWLFWGVGFCLALALVIAGREAT